MKLSTVFLAALVVGLFDKTIVQPAALAVFLLVVARQGGNTAAKPFVVLIRALALSEACTHAAWCFLLRGLSMLSNMETAGAAIPLLLSRIRRDSAHASAILLITVIYGTDFILFLGLAMRTLLPSYRDTTAQWLAGKKKRPDARRHRPP